ncbi:acetyl-CoA C-acetyltransferase [Alteribacillus persepolensis]|uniref:acetyl-CoA C-acetyltransferase n=1 Tax=Alteribacillus persepolensis TaxID=568899 RepID=A0A1G8JM50_9BACI|nr:acetyl-CoA C-acetyltransferase [Alteribacillus persepolensis]
MKELERTQRQKNSVNSGLLLKKDGSVTAGNASGINDGAAAIIVISERKAKELQIAPLASIRANTSAWVPPRIYGHRSCRSNHKSFK